MLLSKLKTLNNMKIYQLSKEKTKNYRITKGKEIEVFSSKQDIYLPKKNKEKESKNSTCVEHSMNISSD